MELFHIEEGDFTPKKNSSEAAVTLGSCFTLWYFQSEYAQTISTQGCDRWITHCNTEIWSTLSMHAFLILLLLQDGTIRTWDWMSGKLLHTHTCSLPVDDKVRNYCSFRAHCLTISPAVFKPYLCVLQ